MNKVALIMSLSLLLTGCTTRECAKTCEDGKPAKEVVILGIGLGCDCGDTRTAKQPEPTDGVQGYCERPIIQPENGYFHVSLRTESSSGLRVDLYDPICGGCSNDVLLTQAEQAFSFCLGKDRDDGEFWWRQHGNTGWTLVTFAAGEKKTL